jgi:hypothetical protein
MRKLLLIGFVAVMAGCSGSDEITGNDPEAALRCATPTDPNPQLGTPFWVHAGNPATLTREGLTLGLQDVLEDSRCPQPVICPLAGQARVQLVAQHPPDGSSDLLVSTSDIPSSTARYAGYDVQLLQVLPYPEAGHAPTPASGYCVQLSVVTH